MSLRSFSLLPVAVRTDRSPLRYRPTRLSGGPTGGCRWCVELTQQASACIPDEELRERISIFAVVHAHVVKHVLRRESLDAKALSSLITEAEVR